MQLFDWLARDIRPEAVPETAKCDFTAFESRAQVPESMLESQYLWEQQFEAALAKRKAPGCSVRGLCAVCGKDDALFDFTRAEEPPTNWRETLACRPCRLINRWRSCIALLRSHTTGMENPNIYLTETVTPLAQWFSSHFDHVTKSEYFGEDVPRGSKHPLGGTTVDHQDVTDLTYEDASFTHVVTLDVLEHVPSYENALQQFYRVLQPSGTLVISVPFLIKCDETLVRARINSQGETEHLCEPEYHGDPMSKEGVLCYYHFGWDILDTLRSIGFREATVRVVWDPAKGFLGVGQSFITAVR